MVEDDNLECEPHPAIMLVSAADWERDGTSFQQNQWNHSTYRIHQDDRTQRMVFAIDAISTQKTVCVIIEQQPLHRRS